MASLASYHFQESAQPKPAAPVSTFDKSKLPEFYCLTCKLVFRDRPEMIAHFKSDLHRFNLKRKVATLRPVTQAELDKKLETAKGKEKAKAEKAAEKKEYYCVVCKKSFASLNAFNAHLQSKKHKRLVKEQKKKEEEILRVTDKTNAPVVQQKAASDETLDDRIKNAKRAPLTECLFDGHQSKTVEENLKYMRSKYNFKIYDEKYCINKEGMLRYLVDKVTLGYTCIYCHKEMSSLHELRDHMIQTGHTRLPLEDDVGEFEGYYDFSPSYPDATFENKDEELAEVESNIQLADDGYELVISYTDEEGAKRRKTVGHRDLALYYKQNNRERRLMAPDLLAQMKRREMMRYAKQTRLPQHMVKRNRQLDLVTGMRSNILFTYRTQNLFI